MQAARLVAVALSSLGEPDSVLGLHEYCLHTFAPLQLLLQRQAEQFSVGSDAARRLEFSWLQAVQLAVSFCSRETQQSMLTIADISLYVCVLPGSCKQHLLALACSLQLPR